MKQVLFVCFGNSCRSPMAEGFANHYGKSWLTASSAGTNPVGFIMPNTIEVMQEKGIDISGQTSKGIGVIDLKSINWLIIMEPMLAHLMPENSRRVEKLVWPVLDPVGQSLAVYRQVRDQIELRVLEFIDLVRKSN